MQKVEEESTRWGCLLLGTLESGLREGVNYPKYRAKNPEAN
jgi:hypothetical protein